MAKQRDPSRPKRKYFRGPPAPPAPPPPLFGRMPDLDELILGTVTEEDVLAAVTFSAEDLAAMCRVPTDEETPARLDSIRIAPPASSAHEAAVRYGWAAVLMLHEARLRRRASCEGGPQARDARCGRRKIRCLPGSCTTPARPKSRQNRRERTSG